jgi:hypothetical protein
VDRGNAFSVSGKINADSGSSGTYVAIRDSSALVDVRATTQSSRIGVMVANGETMFSSHTGALMLPSGHLLRAHIFAELNTSLLSISDLVDVGYEITYSKLKVDFKLDNATIFEGQRDLQTGLWMVDFAVFKVITPTLGRAKWTRGQISKTLERGCGNKPTTHFAQPAVEVNNRKDFVSYWHAAFGFPSKSTFVRNILNKNISIEGLTASSVRRNFVPSVYTAMGHLDATRSNIRSTKEPFVSESSHPHTQLH